MSKLNELTTITPTIDDYVPSLDASSPTTLQKTTWQTVRDLFKTYFDTIYQAILVSGTNIKTLNGISLLWSGDLTIPTLSDWDKGDITLSSSVAVWTIDNNVVTNAKLATVSTATIKGRSTAWTWDVEDLTWSQTTALLAQFSSSAQWVVPAYGSGNKVLTSSGWSAWNVIIYKTITSVSKNNYTGWWTSAYSTTIPWGTIASWKGIKIEIYLKSKNYWFNDYRDDNAIKITLWGTDVISKVITPRASTQTEYMRKVEFIVLWTWTSAQNSVVYTMWSDIFSSVGTASTTIDTSSDITIAIFAWFEYASSTNITDFYTVTIEAI